MPLFSPATLFGVPLQLEFSSASVLMKLLEDAWITNYARSPQRFDDDLKALKLFFDPVATGKRLRDAVERTTRLPRIPDPPIDITRLVMVVDERRYIVRPEGRLVLEVLRESDVMTYGEDLVISTDRLLACTHAAAEIYATWGIHRLESVVESLGGSKPLQAQALGMVLWLLVNRCTSPDRAIPRNKDDVVFRGKVDSALAVPVQAFAKCITRGGPSRDRQKLSLYSGWQLSESKRRLGSKLVVLDERTFIRSGEEQAVTAILAHDLRKRGSSAEQVSLALSEFESAFAGQAPALAALGLYFATATESRRLKESLLKGISEANNL